jgi:hypothetical protein
LSLIRTPNSVKSVKNKIYLGGTATALAVVAAMAGMVSVWSTGAAAQPARIARQAITVSPSASSTASPAGSGSWHPAPGRQQSAKLDAFSATAVSSSRPRRPAQGGGPVTKGGKGVRLTPKQIAREMLPRFGWSRGQFGYLNLLWTRESDWNVFASNPYSGAYGIPQAVPGAKMASAGPNWQTSARTQIRWGLGYIKQRYGSPWAAWQHELAYGWY